MNERVLRCTNCGGDHVSTGCPDWQPYRVASITQEEVDDYTADPFLMVVTDVDHETQTVTLCSVHDWGVPAKMEWYYGDTGIPTGSVLDKVGECYRVTLEKLP
jgi:hypothetical protein